MSCHTLARQLSLYLPLTGFAASLRGAQQPISTVFPIGTMHRRMFSQRARLDQRLNSPWMSLSVGGYMIPGAQFDHPGAPVRSTRLIVGVARMASLAMLLGHACGVVRHAIESVERFRC